MPPFPKLRLRPDPNHPPTLTRGGPLGGPDPSQPAAASSPSNVQQTATNAIRQIKPAAPTSPEDDVGDLASLKQQHDKELAATQEQLAAGKAQSLQTAAAKSGAAGFGLSGASAALQGDVGRAADRSAVLTLADLRGKQNDENFTELQREVALNQAEEDADTDLNHDGFINGVKVGGKVGDHNPDNNPDATNPDDPNGPHAKELQALRAKSGGTGAPNDPYGGIGGYGDSSQDVLDTFKEDNITFSYVRTEGGVANGEQYVIAIGSDGKYYKFKVPGSGLGVFGGKDRSIDDVKSWFATYEGGS